MDYVASDLNKMLSSVKEDEFSEDHAKLICYNILCAIAFMHSAGVMHRDIKPGNLLINDKLDIQICDFGLGRTELA